MKQQFVLNTPVGVLTLVAEDEKLVEIHLPGKKPEEPVAEGCSPILRKAAEELLEYFAGERRIFDLPLNPAGTLFQQRVWKELCRIPYGQTVAYGEIARRIGSPGGARAVGQANHRNPIPVVIPCHRVIAAHGRLGGYGGGLLLKTTLLKLEGNSAFEIK